jgi:nitrogen fixation protein
LKEAELDNFFVPKGDLKEYIPVEAAEGKTAHNNGWNKVNEMASNTWKPCV